ncbi:hypothetical protein BN166_170011 [Clostridioides difficile E10]|nr:hypothetical protein BN166_170011 [Clostridioides difficile E10]
MYERNRTKTGKEKSEKGGTKERVVKFYEKNIFIIDTNSYWSVHAFRLYKR